MGISVEIREINNSSQSVLVEDTPSQGLKIGLQFFAESSKYTDPTAIEAGIKNGTISVNSITEGFIIDFLNQITCLIICI